MFCCSIFDDGWPFVPSSGAAPLRSSMRALSRIKWPTLYSWLSSKAFTYIDHTDNWKGDRFHLMHYLHMIYIGPPKDSVTSITLHITDGVQASEHVSCHLFSQSYIVNGRRVQDGWPRSPLKSLSLHKICHLRTNFNLKRDTVCTRETMEVGRVKCMPQALQAVSGKCSSSGPSSTIRILNMAFSKDFSDICVLLTVAKGDWKRGRKAKTT